MYVQVLVYGECVCVILGGNNFLKVTPTDTSLEAMVSAVNEK